MYISCKQSIGIFMSTCNVDVRWFPFDTQKCELKFGSWTYDGWLLDLQMSEADISGYMPNGEWDLVGEWRRNKVIMALCDKSHLESQTLVHVIMKKRKKKKNDFMEKSKFAELLKCKVSVTTHLRCPYFIMLLNLDRNK